MRTYDDIRIAALARALDWNVTVPSSKSVMFNKVGGRQQELFTLAAAVDPEYYEVQAIGTLSSGAVDIALMLTDGVLECVKATKAKVETLIGSPSANAPEVGDEIHLIPASDDPDAYLAPRATIKNKILEQVGTDLVDVESIRLFYSYRPDGPAVDEDGTTELALEQPFDDLLVIDLARDLARKTIGMDAQAKLAITAALDEEEKGLLGTFQNHIRSFSAARQSRMAHTTGQLTG